MEWKIKRDDREFTAPDTATLQLWAREGLVVQTDYVLNPTLGRWMYASEIAELAGHFQTRMKSAVNAKGCAAAIALGLLAVMFFMWNVPLLGVVFMLGAVIALGVALAT